MQALKIGELAKRAEVSVDTIRFYERRGLLPRPYRRPSGYRVYSSDTADRVRLVKFLQALGFTLDEIVLSLNDIDQGAMDQQTGEARLAAVLQRVEDKIAALHAVRDDINAVLEECRAGRCRLAANSPDLECVPDVSAYLSSGEST
jgi:DNA-binding transcriptional MerR regulator